MGGRGARVVSLMPTYRLVTIVLLALLAWFQYRLWLDESGFRQVRALKGEIASQQVENERLRERNSALEAEVRDLKQGLDAVEERARTELGMIRKGETFYQVVEQ